METIFYLTKLLLMLAGICFIYNSSKKESNAWQFSLGCILVGLVAFMTGVEFMSPVENAWTYWLFEAGQEDYSKALFGGSMMLSIPVILMAVCGKDITKIIESSDSTSSKEPK